MTTDESKPEESEPQGIECPKCGCRHLYVVYTRQRNKRILRVRQCRYCGRRVMTCEEIIG
jgi:hypothetical protein